MGSVIWLMGLSMIPPWSNSSGEAYETPARIASLALLASAQHVNSGNGAVWLVEERVHTREEIIAILRTVRKPVACEAVLEGSFIRLSVRSMTDSVAQADHRNRESKSFAGMSAVLRRQFGRADSDAHIDLRWSQESLVVSLQDLRDWFLDYRVESLLSRMEDPDDAAIESGAIAIIRFGSVRGLTGRLELR